MHHFRADALCNQAASAARRAAGPDSVQPINASALTNAAILGDASFTAQLAPERNMTTAMIVDIHTLTV